MGIVWEKSVSYSGIIRQIFAEVQKKIVPVELSDIGQDVYPSATGGDGKRIGKTSFHRCVQCGFVNDTRSTAVGDKGDGLTGEPATITEDQTVTGWCAFCGSKRWLPHQPPKYPIDQFLPSDKLDR